MGGAQPGPARPGRCRRLQAPCRTPRVVKYPKPAPAEPHTARSRKRCDDRCHRYRDLRSRPPARRHRAGIRCESESRAAGSRNAPSSDLTRSLQTRSAVVRRAGPGKSGFPQRRRCAGIRNLPAAHPSDCAQGPSSRRPREPSNAPASADPRYRRTRSRQAIQTGAAGQPQPARRASAWRQRRERARRRGYSWEAPFGEVRPACRSRARIA